VISELITQGLNTVTESRLQSLLWPKSEVIHLLFLYAVRRERCGDAGLFDAILNLTKRKFDKLRSEELLWHLSAWGICNYGSPRAIALAGPYIDWGQGQSVDAQGLVSRWAARISAVPRTEEVAGSVVDTLLQIAANPHLLPSIPPDVWSWLNERPSLPHACRGLILGCNNDIVRTVRALDDTEILTSYLVTIWTERRPLDYDNSAEMQISVCEDFKGIGVGYHRAELIQRLESILTLLSLNGTIPEWVFVRVGNPYQDLKRVLQEVDRKATGILNRMPSNFIFLSMLTLMGLHRTLPHLHVCPASPVSITSRLGRLTLFEINHFFYSHSIPFSRCGSKEVCYSLFFATSPSIFAFAPTFCIVLVNAIRFITFHPVSIYELSIENYTAER